MKNNLFYYATKELSQDAFICWLMSFAMKNAKKEEGLCLCAKNLIRQFIKCDPTEEVWVTNIQRQYKSIDVLITINDYYLVVIEDKTYTEEHDDQLARYKKIIMDDFPEKVFKGVFWVIGFQHNLENVLKNGYLLFDRKMILSSLEKYYSMIDNRIFLDYFDFLESLENQICLFKTKPVKEWNWQQINGFYDYLQKNPSIIDSPLKSSYGYIANPSGGFFGMWFYNNYYRIINDSVFDLYLQLEYVNGRLNICYKSSSKSDKKIVGDIRKNLLGLNEKGEFVNLAERYNFDRPHRFGYGKTVTLGVFNESPIDFNNAIEIIKKATNSFLEMINEFDRFFPERKVEVKNNKLTSL